MKKKKQKNSSTELVANAISNLCIPYLRKYEDKIVGIYLSPYTIGGKQKIEIVIAQKGTDELEITKKTISINELKIFITVQNIDKYNKNPNNDAEYKLSKDLKTGVIIYDPNGVVTSRRNVINKNLDINPFFNTFELPDSLRKIIKTKVYSYNKNK